MYGGEIVNFDKWIQRKKSESLDISEETIELLREAWKLADLQGYCEAEEEYNRHAQEQNHA